MAKRGASNLGYLSAPVVAAVGFLSALLTLESVSEITAIIVITGVLFPLTRLFLGSFADPADKRFLAALVLWAIGARFLAFGLIRGLIDPVLLAPDAITYDRGGWAIVQYWEGVAQLPERLQGTLQIGYFYTNAAVYSIFGRIPDAVAVINLFFSVWTVAVMYRLARIVSPEKPAVAKVAAALFAFYPSMILWSVLNIREAPMIFLLTTTVLLFIKLQRRPGPLDLPLLLATMGAMLFYRQYMVALVGGAATVGLIVSFSKTPKRAIIFGGVLLILGTMFAQSAGLAGTLTTDQAAETLGTVQMLREDMARGAGSSFIADSDVSSVGGAITYLPVGLTFFFMAPFPWALESLLQVITLPETLVWYVLIPFGLFGVFHSLRRNALQMVIPIMVLGAVSFSYSLVQGNVGTAFRHRAQIFPLLFLMIAIGLVRWSEQRAVRKQALAQRLSRARSRYIRPRG